MTDTKQSNPQWRKKPVAIEAHQWFKNGDHPWDRCNTASDADPRDVEGQVVRYYRHPGVAGESLCEQCGKPHHIHGWIDTLEQGHRVCPGDWIIIGVKGERYPCKPDIFAATYELASTQPAASEADTPVDDKEHPRFMAGYDAGLKDRQARARVDAREAGAVPDKPVGKLLNEHGEILWLEKPSYYPADFYASPPAPVEAGAGVADIAKRRSAEVSAMEVADKDGRYLNAQGHQQAIDAIDFCVSKITAAPVETGAVDSVIRQAVEATFEQRPGYMKLVAAAVRAMLNAAPSDAPAQQDDSMRVLRIAGTICNHLDTALDQSRVMAAARDIAGFTAPAAQGERCGKCGGAKIEAGPLLTGTCQCDAAAQGDERAADSSWAPDRIWLMDTGEGIDWCIDPAPGEGMHASDAVAYVRAALSRQPSAPERDEDIPSFERGNGNKARRRAAALAAAKPEESEEVTDEMIDAACAAVPDLYRVDAMRALEAALAVTKLEEEQHCQCPACVNGTIHASDCVVHNAPALPVGPCDCGANPGEQPDPTKHEWPAHSDEAAADAYTIQRMGELLAGVAIALKGPEKALHRHGYQDLPELAAKMALELGVYRVAAQAEGQEASVGDAELNDLRVQLAASQASVSHLSRLADYWLALYGVPDDMLGQPGIPCVALPDGPKKGKYINGDDAVIAVRAVIAARAGKGE